MADARRPEAQAQTQEANAFVRGTRRIYRTLGFTSGFKFALFVLFTTPFALFSLVRLLFLNFDGVFCSEKVWHKFLHAAPGECFNMEQQPYKTEFLVHLGGILPAALLACLQFVPAIHQKAPGVHKAIGYLAILLSIVGSVSLLFILPISFGGGLDVVVTGWVVTLAFLWALLMAYKNIKSHQIHRHRVWMLRAWFWAGCIITERGLQMLSAKLLGSNSPNYAMPCDKINSMLHGRTFELYPECAVQSSTVVRGRMKNPTSIVEVAAAISGAFGPALFLAFFLHAVGVEIYLYMTPDEDACLRDISRKRQAQAAMQKANTSNPVNPVALAAQYNQVTWDRAGMWTGVYEDEYPDERYEYREYLDRYD